jgi:8-oxo-dGTP pyrophosphatase MutT (NUDIX family)
MLTEIRQMLATINSPRVEDHPSQAAVLIPITDELSPRIILTKRAAQLRRHAGEIAFPGGKRDLTDSSLLAAALRESEEEIGLALHEVELLGHLRPKITRYDVQVTPFVGLIPADLNFTLNYSELSEVFAVPVSYFADPANLLIDELEYRGVQRKIPRFQYQQYEIWGITAVILVELINIVYRQRLHVDGLS